MNLLFVLALALAQAVATPPAPAVPSADASQGLATLAPTLAPAKELPTPRAMTVLPSPTLHLSPSAAASMLAQPTPTPAPGALAPERAPLSATPLIEAMFALAILGLAFALWQFAKRMGAIARDVTRAREEAAALQRRSLMPVCRLEDPSQAVIAAELGLAAGRQSVTAYRVAGRIVNSGSGPALNVGVLFMVRDNEAGYTEGGRVPTGALPPLGPRDAYPFIVDIRTLTPWDDLARRNDWVIRISYEDVFGQTFATLYESRSSSIRLEQPL